MIALFAAALLTRSPAMGLAFETGDAVLRSCTAKPVSDQCYGYIDGVSDAMSAGAVIVGQRACMPYGAKHSEIAEIVARYIQAHGAYHNSSGAVLVASAMAEAFPCAPTIHARKHRRGRR